MPSHPDRVRRNYHDINLIEFVNPWDDNFEIKILISKLEIATLMSKREIQNYVINKISQKILANDI